MPSLVFHQHPVKKVGMLSPLADQKSGYAPPLADQKGGYNSSLADQKSGYASPLAEQEESPVRDPDTMSDCSSGTISPCKLEEAARDIDMWERKDVKAEQVKVEISLDQPQNVCFVGVLESVKTSTMSKRQKKAFVSGLELLEHHDQVMNGCFRVVDGRVPAAKNVLVITSSPRIFDHPNIRVCDVGPEACHLKEEAHVDMNELCEGIDLAVVVVRYESSRSPSQLERLLSDLESHAFTTGMKMLHVDTLETSRRKENRGRVSEMHLGECLAYTTNDPEVGREFHLWVDDKDVDSLWAFTEWWSVVKT